MVEATDLRSREISLGVRQGLSIGQEISARTRAIGDEMQNQVIPSLENLNQNVVSLNASLERFGHMWHNAATRQDVFVSPLYPCCPKRCLSTA